MTDFTYDFDSIEIQIEGTTVRATGTLEIDYSHSLPEYSTGWAGGVEIQGFGELAVTITQEGDEDGSGPFFYRKGHPVFSAILAACDADIEDAATDDCRWN